MSWPIGDWPLSRNGRRRSRRKASIILSDEESIDAMHGFLPTRAHRVDAGFECSYCSAAEIFACYRDTDFGRQWAVCLGFNRHGFDEGLAAYIAAAAHAKAADGVVYDPQDNVVMTPAQAFAVAKMMDANLHRWKSDFAALVARQAS